MSILEYTTRLVKSTSLTLGTSAS